ncbi:MAG: DUF2092 domain-containing protein [Sedimentitalea sp.]|nr:DUF2092 domain-containing protein [Sedimentitalea sp.]
MLEKMKLPGTAGLAGAAAVAAVLCTAGAARADEAQAREIFQAMADYLVAQTAFSFDYDSTLDIVTDASQKLAIASSGQVTVERPNKIHATRNGGFATVETLFDGETLTVLNVDEKLFAKAPLSGSINDLIDTLRNTYKRSVPAADLLLDDVDTAMMPLFTDVKDLGAGVIRGTVCDHLAFRTEEADLQIWIAQGDTPYPCRYAITNTQFEGWPEYRIDIYNWKAGDAAIADFTLALPDGAQEVEVLAIPHLSELSGIFSVE